MFIITNALVLKTLRAIYRDLRPESWTQGAPMNYRTHFSGYEFALLPSEGWTYADSNCETLIGKIQKHCGWTNSASWAQTPKAQKLFEIVHDHIARRAPYREIEYYNNLSTTTFQDVNYIMECAVADMEFIAKNSKRPFGIYMVNLNP
jgi:hypothetical protein